MGSGPPVDTGAMVAFIHYNATQPGQRLRTHQQPTIQDATHVFSGGDAARVVNAHIPLVQRGDRPRCLALLLRHTGVLEVRDRAARELEDPRCPRRVCERT